MNLDATSEGREDHAAEQRPQPHDGASTESGKPRRPGWTHEQVEEAVRSILPPPSRHPWGQALTFGKGWLFPAMLVVGVVLIGLIVLLVELLH